MKRIIVMPGGHPVTGTGAAQQHNPGGEGIWRGDVALVHQNSGGQNDC